MLSNNISLRKIGMMFLIFTLVFTGLGASLGTPVSYAAPLEVYVSSGGNDQNDGTRENPYATLPKAYQAVVSGGTIYVMDDITLPPPFDMNAAKIFTITTDPEADKPAVINRGSSSGSQTLFGLNTGHLTLENIIIDGGRQSIDGRIFNIGSSKLTIEKDTILRNNYSSNSIVGSAIILLNKASVLEMNGGKITGNMHANSSAVLINIAGARFTMTGGEITGNSGGGVQVKAGEFDLSGNAVITGNTFGESERNVYLDGTTILTLDGDFTGKAGITANGHMNVGSKFGQATASGLAGLQNLIADNNPHLYAAYGEGNNDLVWKSQVGPGGLTDGLVLWLRPDAGINVESGESVSSWEDQSRSANHASQSVQTTQPIYWNEPNHNVNFNPMLRFDGNDFLNLDVSKLPLGKTPRTIVSVAATEAELGNHYIISWGNATWLQMMGMLQIDTTGSLTAYSEEFTSPKDFWTVGVPNELFGTYDGSTGALYSRMNQIGSAARNWDTKPGSANIGKIIGSSGQYWDGTIGDLIVYDRVLNDKERQRISTYLSLKYGYTLENTDYLDTNGTTVWDATENSNYNRNIAGIANDTNGALLQKQSHSTNTGDQVIIGLNQLVEKNSDNVAPFENDRQYLIWGDNGKDLIFDEQLENANHAQRVWKVQNTGEVGQVQVAIPVSAIPEGKKLLVSDSDTDFTSAKSYDLQIQDLNGVKHYVASVSEGLTNGQFFTYGLETPKVESVTLEEVATGGKEITLTFDQEIELTDLTGLTVKIGAKELSINAFEIGTDGKILILKTTEDIKSDDIVKVSYLASEGNIKGTNGALVQDFEKVVENKLTPATPLAVPSNVQVTGDQLTWDAVENAGSYEVSITDSEGKERPVPVANGTTLDLSALAPALVPGEYTITVTAKSNDPAYTDSQASESVTYTVSTTPATPLAVPSNVKMTGDQLTWDAVENAESYEVNITDSEGNVTPVTVPSGTTLDLSTLEPSLAPGGYTLTVTAKSNDPAYTDSQASESVTYTVSTTPATPLAVPSKVQVTGDQLTWDAVENAGSYEVSVTDSEGNITRVPVSSGTTLDLSTLEPSLAPGEYKITVTAKSNDPAYTDSQASESVTYTVPNGSEEVNKTELQKEVDLSEGLIESDYTPESWANLELALAEADRVLKDQNATQADVDQALAELQKALKDLVVLNGELDDLNLVGLTNNGEKDITLEPKFDPNQYKNYQGTVTNNVYGISLNPVVKNPDTQVKVIVNELEYPADKWSKLPLKEGPNVITVGVYDKDGNLINTYTIEIFRERASGNDNSGGGSNPGTDNTTTSPTPPTTDNPVKPGNIVTTVNGSNVSFATGTVTPNGDQATVTIDKNKLSGILADGKGHKLGIRVPGNGDVEVRGLTLEDLKKLADTGSSLEIEDVLAIYPVPAGQLDANAISKQFGNAPISDIAVNIKIKRSAEDLAKVAREKAAQGGYELLVHPVDLDLTFMHDGKTDRAGLLNGYAPKYIALPEGIDPNRITTGVIVNPDGTVFHVPTVVTKVNNRYFALINDLRSSGSYSVIWNPQDFDDVQYHWGRADVNNIAARLDLKGNGDNTFSPNRHVTRSEFAEILVLGLGLMRQDAPQNIFPDVPASVWYRNAVALADEFGIVRGYTDGNFKGGQQITREQGFAMIARAYRLIQSEEAPNQGQIASTLAPYADEANVAAWAKADVAQLINAGIIQGNGPKHISPKEQMTRAEVTALLARMLKVTDLIDK